MNRPSERYNKFLRSAIAFELSHGQIEVISGLSPLEQVTYRREGQMCAGWLVPMVMSMKQG